MLQTRTGKRTTQAAIQIAVDMTNEGLLLLTSLTFNDHLPRNLATIAMEICPLHRIYGGFTEDFDGFSEDFDGFSEDFDGF